MGGLGSGSYLRRTRRTTTEECRRLDIRWLNKIGALVARRTGLISWSSGGDPCGDIGYTTANDRMILNYKYQIHGDDEWQSIEQSVMFNRTPCNYGGSRKWFLCPECERRVAILYFTGELFLCRHCVGLTYSCQREVFIYRLMRKARKIRRQLVVGNDLFEPDCLSDGVYYKPTGMHWRTFERLKQAENGLQARISDEFLTMGVFI